MQASNGQQESIYPTRLNLPPEVQIETIEMLNQTLATTIDLWMQAKCAHWNVKGMQFYSLHPLFDQMAAQFDAFADVLAERVAALGGVAEGSIQVAVVRSQVAAYPQTIRSGPEFVTALADRMAIYAQAVRLSIDMAEGLGEADTADLYTEISRAVDKVLWQLDAHLQL